MCSQRHRIGRGHDRSVDVLSRMMSDTNPTIDPERAHWGEKVCILWSQPIRKRKRNMPGPHQRTLAGCTNVGY
jgi:hypothetical protein